MAIGWVICLFSVLFYCLFKIDNVSTSKLIRFCSKNNNSMHSYAASCLVPLRGDYLKTMFIAVAIDRNNQTLSVTFFLAVENNIYCCTWFLIRLRESLRLGREVSFITNMDDVVSSCIEHVFPDSYHEYTSKSVFEYMHTRGVSGRTLQPLFWMTSNSYTMSDFEENFRGLTPDSHEVLANIVHVK
uniref:Protein FAR1-RELATED SEQUENCE n=1 Tax=Lactuca sativa TaxID=4236 RepID=A0A9R1XFY6_LACSA|nr:hypothetical protein LSAT_V11C400166390 [Lactuca sativa]